MSETWADKRLLYSCTSRQDLQNSWLFFLFFNRTLSRLLFAVVPLAGIPYCKSDSKRALCTALAGSTPLDISLFYVEHRPLRKVYSKVDWSVASGLSSFQVLFQYTNLNFRKAWKSSWMMISLWDIKNFFILEHSSCPWYMIYKASCFAILGFAFTENLIKLSSQILYSLAWLVLIAKLLFIIRWNTPNDQNSAQDYCRIINCWKAETGN